MHAPRVVALLVTASATHVLALVPQPVTALRSRALRMGALRPQAAVEWIVATSVTLVAVLRPLLP